MKWHYKFILSGFFILFLLLLNSFAFSQGVAPNIGFEDGTFNNWKRYFGTIDTLGKIVVYEGVPYINPFVIFGPMDTARFDPIGNFPVRSPNGSKYSIMLGDTVHGNAAQRIAYTLTVPEGTTSIVFDYAVVLENPKHLYFQQPRFTVKVFNVTDNTYLDCPSFDFISSDNLPGFKQVGDVFYKDWSAATIDLKNFADKIVRLEFTVNHCSFGAHFGYAYLDINENIGTAIVGNAYCKQQNTVTLRAPVGFASYNWYSGDLKNLAGTGQRLTLSPPPPDKSLYAVVVTPYNNLGCTDTLYTIVNRIDNDFTLKVTDTVYGCPGAFVNLTSANITAGSSPGTTFAYYTSATADSTLAYPDHITRTGTYYIQGTDTEGCTGIMPVYVNFSLPDLKINNPPALIFPATADLSTTFKPQTGVIYSFYTDATATNPLLGYKHVASGGTYYIKATDQAGCSVIQPVIITIKAPPFSITAPNAFTPNGDGINDYFGLTITGYVKFGSLRIFDRYGRLVYSTTSVGTRWAGIFNGSLLPAGVYYWLFEGENPYNNSKVKEAAFITLIR